ncbi:MAG: hypothetical protein QXP36_13370 [Conexivisphaerales archaeon]
MVKLVEKEEFEKQCEYIDDDALVIVNRLGDWAILTYDVATSSDKIISGSLLPGSSREEIKEIFEDIRNELNSYGSKFKNFTKVRAKVIHAHENPMSDDAPYLVVFPNGEWFFGNWTEFRDTSRGVKVFEVDKDYMDCDDVLKMVESEKEFIEKLHKQVFFKEVYQDINNEALLAINSSRDWTILEGGKVTTSMYPNELRDIDTGLNKEDMKEYIQDAESTLKSMELILKDADKLKEKVDSISDETSYYLVIFTNGEWVFSDYNFQCITSEGVKTLHTTPNISVDTILDSI